MKQDLISAEEIHRRILEDIRQKTGLALRHVQGADTAQGVIAEKVLPVLAEWVPHVMHRNIRAAIYNRFVTKFAAPFIQTMVNWAQHEPDLHGLDALYCALAVAAQAPNAESLWDASINLPKTDNYYLLLAKLASFPQISADVKDKVVQELEDPRLGFAALKALSEVDDPRVVKAFESRATTPDKGIQALVRRVVNRSKRLPSGLEYIGSEPDRNGELFSTEVDLDQLEPTLKELARNFRLKIPSSVLKGHFLSQVALNRWVATAVNTSGNDQVHLAFRLEDVDTVEIVLLPRPTAGSELTQ